MILSKVPFRLSICGGGLDLPSFFSQEGGLVVGGAINKHAYISLRYLPPFFKYTTRLVYSQIEEVLDNSEIEHRAIKAIFEEYGLWDKGLELIHFSDLPGSSGIGSSSSFVVGLIHAVWKLKYGTDIRPIDLWKEAVRIEREVLKEAGGIQDQAWAAFGGFNKITIDKKGDIGIFPIPITADKLKKLEHSILLFYTGISRFSSTVSSTYPVKLSENDGMKYLMKLTENAIDAIQNDDIMRLGRLIEESWVVKKSLSPMVSSPEIDDLYNRAKSAGAIGGKIIGSGGGGMLMMIAEEKDVPRIKHELVDLLHIDFSFEHSGSRIIHVG